MSGRMQEDLIALYCPEEHEKIRQTLLRWDIRVEGGCGAKIKANTLAAHQKEDCPERFILCKHDCGQYIKYRLQFTHEDT